MTSKPANAVEEFRRATGAAMRAISERNDLQATFAPGPAALLGSEARLPLPSKSLPAHEVAQTRGEADAIALKLQAPQRAGPCQGMPEDRRWRATCSTRSSRRATRRSARAR